MRQLSGAFSSHSSINTIPHVLWVDIPILSYTVAKRHKCTSMSTLIEQNIPQRTSNRRYLEHMTRGFSPSGVESESPRDSDQLGRQLIGAIDSREDGELADWSKSERRWGLGVEFLKCQSTWLKIRVGTGAEAGQLVISRIWSGARRSHFPGVARRSTLHWTALDLTDWTRLTRAPLSVVARSPAGARSNVDLQTLRQLTERREHRVIQDARGPRVERASRILDQYRRPRRPRLKFQSSFP